MKVNIDCLLVGYSGLDLNKFRQEKLPYHDIVLKLQKPLNAAIAYLGTYLDHKGFSFDYANCYEDEMEILKKN